MSTVESKLAELGFQVPAMVAPLAAYVPAVRAGDLVFVSGQLPIRDGELVYSGKVGADVSEEDAYKAAQLCILNALAALKAEVGDLDQVRQIVKLTGWVNSAPGFQGQPQVINGASELLGKVFGDQGKHARAAVGANELPRGTAVEIEMIATL